MKHKNENLLFYGNSSISRLIMENIAEEFDQTIFLGRRKVDLEGSRSKFIKINDLKSLSEINRVFQKVYETNFFDKPVHIFLGAYDKPKSGDLMEVDFKEFSDQIISNLNIIHNLLKVFTKKLKQNSSIILFSGGGIGGDTKLNNADSYLIMKVIGNEIIEICSRNKYFIKNRIRVFGVSPGPFLSPLSKSFEHNTIKFSSKIVQTNKYNLIKLVEFLLNRKSSYLSGSILSSRNDSLVYLEKLNKRIAKNPKLKYELGLFARRRKIII